MTRGDALVLAVAGLSVAVLATLAACPGNAGRRTPPRPVYSAQQHLRTQLLCGLVRELYLDDRLTDEGGRATLTQIEQAGVDSRVATTFEYTLYGEPPLDADNLEPRYAQMLISCKLAGWEVPS